MRKLYFFLAFCTMSCWGLAQTPSLKQMMKAAGEAYEDEDYYSAFKYYETALDYDSNQVETWWGLAESARRFNAYREAIQGYEYVLDSDQASNYPEARFHLADMYHRLGEYETAAGLFQDFIDESGSRSPKLAAEAERCIQNCEWALNQPRPGNNREPGLTPVNLGASINTIYSDFGGFYKGDTLYYSSLSYLDKKDRNNPSRVFTRILYALDTSTYLLMTPPDGEGIHQAYSAFSEDGNRMYFAQCNYIGRSDAIRCDLYQRQRINGSWENTARPLTINVEGYNTTQPALGVLKGEEVLFFSAERPDKPGLDLYYGKVEENGDVTEAHLLDTLRINSPGNEVAPFFDRNTNNLYFSSDHHLGFGGYDIFKVQLDQEGAEVKNLGPSVNSSFDDIHFSLDKANSKAVFSSNRLGSVFIEEEKEACCYDLFRFEAPLRLDIRTFNGLDSTALAGSTVYINMIDPQSGEVILLDSITNPSANDFSYPLSRDRDYVIEARKDGFFSDSLTIQKEEFPDFSESSIERDLYLTPLKIRLDAFTIDARDSSALMGGTVSLFKIVNGDTILVDSLTKGDANLFSFPIDVDQPYFIKAIRPGYQPFSAPLIVTRKDVQTLGRKIQVTLPLMPKDLCELLPIALYFDNAKPDPRSYGPTTDKIYGNLAREYYLRKATFIQRITANLDSLEAFTKRRAFEDFFDREVKEFQSDFRLFGSRLKEYLEAGNSIVIGIRGFSSPRAGKEYNYYLSQRRINSVVNFFNTFQDGMYKPYIENGQLSFSEVVCGEDGCGDRPEVPDDLADEVGSIFSLLATLERRVEIQCLPPNN